jgi:hypothetical protein
MKKLRCKCNSTALKPISGIMIGDPITKDRKEWVVYKCLNCKIAGVLTTIIKNRKKFTKYTLKK